MLQYQIDTMEGNKQRIVSIMSFLDDLQKNNNRPWFNSHKNRYLQVKTYFEELVDYLIKEIAKFDNSFIPQGPNDYIFRIYRDTRFSKNKAPYKEQFGAFIANGGRKSGFAGYYFHLEPDNTMAAGGIYRPESKVLKSVRTEVLFHSNEFKRLLNDNDFVKRFGGLADIKLKRPPKGFPKNHSEIELAKYKSYIYSQLFTNKQVMSDRFMGDIADSFRAMKNITRFINNAIQLINEE